MGWLDKVPHAGELYIGGLYALKRHDAIKAAKITHVVSVLRWPIEEQLMQPYKHLQIDVDDDEEENLLEFFPASNRFIGDALDNGGSVLVHCAMGKSRSATIVIAYTMQKFHISPAEALSQLRESRGVCEPNDGFMRQLELYHRMHMPADVEADPIYQRWMYQRELDLSRACGQAPEAEKIRFEDEHTQGTAAEKEDGGLEFRCRKCRRTLASSQYLIPHTPKKPEACSHNFLDALSWMRPELEQGKTEGRLECPKCKVNVGKYAWQGMQCNCGEWVVPGISLAKSRVDEVKSRPAGGGGGQGDFGIRMPPGGGFIRGGNNGNL